MINGPKICTGFKRDLLHGYHAFDRDQFALALYTAGAPLDPDDTTSYTTYGEVVAPGYVAGGQWLLNPQILTMGGICFVTFDDPVWNGTIVARAALIYNYSSANRAVAILDFGADQRSNQGSFHVQFPPPGPATGLIRIV